MQTRINVLLLENVHPSATQALEECGFNIQNRPSALTESELKDIIPGVQLLGIRSKTRVGGEVLRHARELMAVGCFCIGTDQVALHEANRLGIPVFNAPFSSTRSVAELTIGEIIALSRQLADRSMEVHTGQWRKVAKGCHEARGRTVGIVGYGHIGSQVGVLAESLGLRVIFFDISTRLPMGNNRRCASLKELLEHADFVTLHVPDTPLTRGMIGAEELRSMKPGGYLINTSRGSVVDVNALTDALSSGHLAGAAVDVYPEEPESNTDEFLSPLRGLRNVILTPHVGGSTEEAQEAIGREVAASLSAFALAGSTAGSVNFPIVELPQTAGTHRILNVHRNLPGVLRAITSVVSGLDANIHSQVLATDPHIGVMLMDLDQDVSEPVKIGIEALPTSIRTRILS